MTKQQALSKADELIESDDNLIYDVAWEHGQIVDNVKEMKWFREAVAHSIMIDPNNLSKLRAWRWRGDSV